MSNLLSSLIFSSFYELMRGFQMRIVLIAILSSTFLFAVGGVVIFNDGTTIEGDVSSVSENTVSITPMGLTFPEEIRIENVDSLRLYDGKLLIANNEVRLMYANGEFYETGISPDNNEAEMHEDYDVEYVIIPNWSLNFYSGYPIVKGSTFDYYDDINPVLGLSIGSPYGLFLGDFFMNVISEIAYYEFNVTNNPEYENFAGMAYQVGLSPGLFIGETSISLTACTGVYHAGSGFIGGGSIDLPIGNYLLNSFEENDFIQDNSDIIEALEIRLTGRGNTVKKTDGTTTYWLGAGISLGYEF